MWISPPEVVRTRQSSDCGQVFEVDLRNFRLPFWKTYFALSVLCLFTTLSFDLTFSYYDFFADITTMIQYDKEISERLGLPLSSPSDIFSDTNNNKNSNADSTSHSYAEKYSLRPRSLRKRGHHSDEIEEVQSKSSKPRKSTLLSKYRRKTANARERNRMREINQAFETLRRVIPDMSRTHTENEKVTKITTLRLAMKYISTLTATLSSRDSNQDIFSDCSEMDCFLLESDGDSLTIPSDLSDHSVTPADFTVDFSENSLDFTPLSPELPDQLFDPFLMDFS